VRDVPYVLKTTPDKGQELPVVPKSVGGTPLEDLITDFSEMPRVRGYKYLLVFICTFSGWVEAFPTWTEKAQEVARCLLMEIIPQFGIPVSVGLGNGPAFVAEVVQLMAKSLGITWKLHTAYHPEFRKSGVHE
jgi:transposase InsO family protein